MQRTLRIELVDLLGNQGGGTKLTIKVIGETLETVVDGKWFPRERLDEAREVAIGYLREARFENVKDERPPA